MVGRLRLLQAAISSFSSPRIPSARCLQALIPKLPLFHFSTIPDNFSTIPDDFTAPAVLSNNARKRLLKAQRYEAFKAEAKALKESERERKREKWAEELATLSEEDKLKALAKRREVWLENLIRKDEEKKLREERRNAGKISGLNVVIDLEFSGLMNPLEIDSLLTQIQYCYAANGRCSSPAHLWLTGFQGEMDKQLQEIPGFEKWIIDKDTQPYIQTFKHQKEHLVYLTPDSETMLDDVDPKKIYIVGGLVDRTVLKGTTMKKAKEQNIQTAKLPIENFLKMSGSQVLTVNQVIEILLKYLETRDWEDSFFQVIPQRKKFEADSEENQGFRRKSRRPGR